MQLQDLQIANKNVFEMSNQELNTALGVFIEKEKEAAETGGNLQDQYQRKLSAVLEYAQTLFAQWSDFSKEMRR